MFSNHRWVGSQEVFRQPGGIRVRRTRPHSICRVSTQREPGEKSLSRSGDRKFTAACFFFFFFSSSSPSFIRMGCLYPAAIYSPNWRSVHPSLRVDPFEIYETREIRGPRNRKKPHSPSGEGVGLIGNCLLDNVPIWMKLVAVTSLHTTST